MKDKLENCLFEFVERVAKGKATSETEIEILPEVANVLAMLIKMP